VRYFHGQVRELCTNYGRLGGILFDGFWLNDNASMYDKPDFKHFAPLGGEPVGDCDWEFGKLYDMIHELQPEAVVTNNIHGVPLDGEDYVTLEQDMPGENTFGCNTPVASDKPRMSWITMNGNWDYVAGDTNFKPAGHLLRMLMIMAGKNVNFFLNIGPDGLGRIRHEERERLAAVGAWMKENAAAIYGTRPVQGVSVPWGYAVQKEDRVYIIAVYYPGKKFTLNLPFAPKSACLLCRDSYIDPFADAKTQGGASLEEKCKIPVENGAGGTTFTMPDVPFNPIGMVIEVK